MDIEEEVRELIDCHGESDYLDFKEEDYHKENKVELVKDVIALANSHSTRNKFIIIGIKEENNVCEDILGIDKDKVRDEAEFQQIVKTYIKDDLLTEYKIINIDGKDLLVIKIPATNNVNRPFMVKTQIKHLKENEIHIRKGSTTVLANKKDLEIMFKENKSSKLIIQSYLNGKISNKIQLSEINSIIEKYKQDKFEQLKQRVDKINKLIGSEFSFGTGHFLLISDEEVKIDKEIEENIKKGLKNLKINFDDSIFEFKNVRWKTTFNGSGFSPVTKTLYGDENEIKRYWKLKDLDSFILEYLAINYYFNGLPKIYNTNLLISNIGNYLDEDIELKLIINKEIFTDQNSLIVDDDVIKYLGNMYSDLKEELIQCPRISNIDEYYYPSVAMTSVSDTSIPSYINSIYSHKPTYLDKLQDKADDFKCDIENLFEDAIYEENGKIIIKIDFKKIMQNKSMFLEAKLLFKSEKVKIDYEIRTKNIPKTIYGTIES